MLATISESGAAETTKLFVRFLTLTATRSGGSRGARWEEVDGDVWSIPESRMKSGKEHRVPLSSAALDVLQRARELTGGQGLIFPSRRTPYIGRGAEQTVRGSRHRLRAARHEDIVQGVGG